MEPQEQKKFPELAALEGHFARLIERGARECAMGALHHGLAEIARTVAAHPECALGADRLLAEQDDAISGYIGTGSGIQVARILARLIDEIRPGPEATGFNPRHHPMTAAAPRLDIPALAVDIGADGGIKFVPAPAPNEKHDDE
jgi:hypothetical protein